MRETFQTADETVRELLALEASADLFLLDSCGRDLGGSRFLIAGTNAIEKHEFDCRTPAEARAVLRFLDDKLKFYEARADVSKPFGGGFCGATFAYEFGLLLENIEPRPKEFSGFNEPSATIAFYDDFLVRDYLSDAVGTMNDKRKAKNSDSSFIVPTASFQSNFARAEYLAAVAEIKNHIRRGDIYQANLTQRLRVNLSPRATPEQIFLNLRQNHPAPFAAFVRRENDTIVSASPERFFKIRNPKSEIRNREIIVSPIKGTRRRGANREEDERLENELLQSAKDRAENVMIVDLLRNDIGRVCEAGTVESVKLCEIERHETLFHLVSTVRGRLRDAATAGDVLRATFPCGSITGAPKISAMRILDRVETAPRGISMGAIGYFAFDGSADLNVAIRTMTIRDGAATFNVGGGIVADSDPAAEFEESRLKAKALLAAVGAA